MIRYDEALSRLQRLASDRRLASEHVPIVGSVGRVLAQVVRTREPWPHFRTSNMDGYALRSHEAPGRLRLDGEVTAGQTPGVAVRDGYLVRVTTGAAVPSGADAVVRIEDTTTDGQQVDVKVALTAGDNIREVGSDEAAGTELLRPGRTLMPDDVLILANAGLAEVEVVRRPRLALIATGNELVDAAQQQVAIGEVRNTTTPYLCAALATCELVAVHHCRDDRSVFDGLLQKVRELAPDLVITTGAVSMGGAQDILTNLVSQPLFHGVAIRPGRPLACAALDAGCVWFGLPGNQLSAVVAVEHFVKPFLAWISGAEPSPWSGAHLTEAVLKPTGLRCFFRGRVEHEAGAAQAQVLPAQASYRLHALGEANAWIALPEDADRIEAGTVISWRAR